VLAIPGAIVEYLDEVYREKILIGINPVDRAEVRRLTAWFDIKMNHRGHREPCSAENDDTLSRQGSRIRQAIRAGHANLPAPSRLYRYLVDVGDGWPATISRSPTSPPRHSCRASIISVTCVDATSPPKERVCADQVRGRALFPS